jgi:hypothetical protein
MFVDHFQKRDEPARYAGRVWAADQPNHWGKRMDYRTRVLIAVAFIAGLSSLTRLLFVVTKLPVIFWPDLLGGIFAAVITAFLLILLRKRLRRAA